MGKKILLLVKMFDEKKWNAIEQILEGGGAFMRIFFSLLMVVLISILGFKIEVGAFKLPDTGQDKCYDFFENLEISCVSNPYGQDAVYSQGPPIEFYDNDNDTVTDMNTGLIWQKNDDGITRYWSAAKSYCESLELGGHTDWRLPSRRELLLLVNFGYEYPAIDLEYFPECHGDWYWSSTQLRRALRIGSYSYGGEAMALRPLRVMKLRQAMRAACVVPLRHKASI